MSRVLETSEEDVKQFIFDRLSTRLSDTLISVSVRRYPGEYSATVWITGAPTVEMREHAHELEAELTNLGAPCNIIVKSDQERPFGEAGRLHTDQGVFAYRYLRADSRGDEDLVYVFSLYRGDDTYRYRLSLSGTLASMLRMRNKLDHEKVIEVYKDQLRARIAQGKLRPDEMERIMLDSRHKKLFGVG